MYVHRTTRAEVAALTEQGLTPAEIAARTGATINTIRVHLHHLRKPGALARQAHLVRTNRRGEVPPPTPEGIEKWWRERS